MPKLIEDYRIGGDVRYHLADSEDFLMQVPDEVKKCVVFVGCRTADGYIPLGTAFYVGVPIDEIPDRHWVHLVTAKHLIDDIKEGSLDGQVYLRINFRNQPAQWVSTSPSQWLFHPNDQSIDVAVLPAPPTQNIDYLAIPIAMAATKGDIPRPYIGVGDEVFITGLFVGHSGQRNNEPIIRVGNIAAIPAEQVHVRFRAGWSKINAYLIEARSIGGLSGSPVFVHLSPVKYTEGEIKFLRGGPWFYWLGLIHGHWDLPSPHDLIEGTLQREAVNMGIAIVIPVSKILEVINQAEIVAMRKRELETRWEGGTPTPDKASPQLSISPRVDEE